MERKIQITDKIARNLSQEMSEKYGYETKVWWHHHFFMKSRPMCNFVADQDKDYVIFPNDEMTIMFLLKYAS